MNTMTFHRRVLLSVALVAAGAAAQAAPATSTTESHDVSYARYLTTVGGQPWAEAVKTAGAADAVSLARHNPFEHEVVSAVDRAPGASAYARYLMVVGGVSPDITPQAASALALRAGDRTPAGPYGEYLVNVGGLDREAALRASESIDGRAASWQQARAGRLNQR